MKKYIGCDLGGTNLRAAIVDVESGTVLEQMSEETLAREGHDAVMQRMGDLVLSSDPICQIARMRLVESGLVCRVCWIWKKARPNFLPNLPGTWPDVPSAG